jgi:hypothetical protein
MRKLYMIFSLSLVTVLAANGQAFYNAGTVTIEGTGLLYVDGDVEIASTGSVTNDGIMEIKGDYTNARTDGAISNGAAGERIVKLTGAGSLQTISAPNASSLSFYELETQNPATYIAGSPAAGVQATTNIVINGEVIFNSGALMMESNDLILGLNAIPSGYSGFYSAHFTSGSFVKKVATGQASTVHQFPYYKRDFNGGTYLPATLRLNTAPVQADEIRVKFEDNSALGNIFHVGGCSNIGPGGNQNIMLNRMVENFGVWRIDAEDASNNNLDNTAGWEYDLTLYPTATALNNLTSTYGSEYYKLLRIPSHSGNTLLNEPGSSTDWSAAPTQSGTYCDGIVEIAAYSQSTGITATQLNLFSRFGGAGNEGGASLPIELISLEAVPVDNQFIAVNWATSIEINNSGFEVLRSTDGDNFTVQGWVDGNGNSTVQHNYSFLDKNVLPNQLYYYRLRQVDNDNNAELTHIVNAMITGSTVFTISDFIPNPTHSSTRIEIVSSDVKHVSIVIYNTLGQVISNQEVDTNVGTTPINFDMTEVSSGTYYGVIKVDGEEYNKKLVIARQ